MSWSELVLPKPSKRQFLLLLLLLLLLLHLIIPIILIMAKLIKAVLVDVVDVDMMDIELITLADSHPTRPPTAAIPNLTQAAPAINADDIEFQKAIRRAIVNMTKDDVTAFQTVAPDSTPAATPPSSSAVAGPGPSTLANRSEENTEDINMDNNSVADGTSV
ncbi:hypothetical protein M422DRAFT_245539 [Sphaerobolus stellatus SS14]|nr:hypothetical protein M422DRAFT_245539 [Sphaerobolus stellatus SS14]